ncbi:glycoside hydrolase family 19 protein [Paenibacillus sp. 481]|uniref:glycoside hydrolase family 19 protein n=1 Tax=Paenibacillus sp. 481 TaxID=2835869 RepID=UPI001E4B3922|nr:glycoside hydrolase family 19 protein [Paenibacillus sp. 481]UHA73413.1 chitinase [Paenibacillus sp. 481]
MKKTVNKLVVTMAMVIGALLLLPITAFGALSTPTLQVSASQATCTLNWNGISGATGYDVFRNGTWYQWTSSLSYTDSGLTNGTTYTYTVAAQNATTTPITTSPQSAVKTCTPAAGGISLTAPTLNVSTSNGFCTLSWNSVHGATGYDIYRNGSWYQWTSSLSYNDSGLTNGTTYTYTVAAQNATTKPVTTSPHSASKSCKPSAGNGGGGFVVSEAQFNQMFPNRNSFYTYSGLVAALSAYPAFTNTGSDTIKKREAAAFLGNVAQESGHLRYITELDVRNHPKYCLISNTQYPCAPGKQYYGRGPIQLSWNYNYGAAGAALGLPLLTNPDLVATDSSVAWKTALWFWNTQSGAGRMTPHHAIVNNAGFGETIRSINGTVECNGKEPDKVNNRIKYFTNFANLLGVSTGDKLGC